MFQNYDLDHLFVIFVIHVIKLFVLMMTPNVKDQRAPKASACIVLFGVALVVVGAFGVALRFGGICDHGTQGVSAVKGQLAGNPHSKSEGPRAWGHH